MICAIATPCAASAYNSAMNADIPTVYTAVSDPVAAGLAKEDGSSVGNITGSSDVLPVEEQLKMIREMMPDAKKIGILYTTNVTIPLNTPTIPCHMLDSTFIMVSKIEVNTLCMVFQIAITIGLIVFQIPFHTSVTLFQIAVNTPEIKFPTALNTGFTVPVHHEEIAPPSSDNLPPTN